MDNWHRIGLEIQKKLQVTFQSIKYMIGVRILVRIFVCYLFVAAEPVMTERCYLCGSQITTILVLSHHSSGRQPRQHRAHMNTTPSVATSHHQAPGDPTARTLCTWSVHKDNIPSHHQVTGWRMDGSDRKVEIHTIYYLGSIWIYSQ